MLTSNKPATATPAGRRPLAAVLAFFGVASLAAVGVHRAARNDLVDGWTAAPAEKWNLGNLGLCRAEWSSCHVWDCCASAGDGKPMWCNPNSGGEVAGLGKARCVVCEKGVETGHGEGSGGVCDVTQTNAYGKDGLDEVAIEVAQGAANLEASRIKGSMDGSIQDEDDTLIAPKM